MITPLDATYTAYYSYTVALRHEENEMLYRVNYNYVNTTGYMRSAVLIVEAKDPKHARKTAEQRMLPSHQIPAITNVYPYLTPPSKDGDDLPL